MVMATGNGGFKYLELPYGQSGTIMNDQERTALIEVILDILRNNQYIVLNTRGPRTLSGLAIEFADDDSPYMLYCPWGSLMFSGFGDKLSEQVTAEILDKCELSHQFPLNKRNEMAHGDIYGVTSYQGVELPYVIVTSWVDRHRGVTITPGQLHGDWVNHHPTR